MEAIACTPDQSGEGLTVPIFPHRHPSGSFFPVSIEPEYRTRIKSYVTEKKLRPVTTKERIVVGSPVPADVELEAVPSDWGPSLTKYRYVYSNDRVMLVDPRAGSFKNSTNGKRGRESGPHFVRGLSLGV